MLDHILARILAIVFAALTIKAVAMVFNLDLVTAAVIYLVLWTSLYDGRVIRYFLHKNKNKDKPHE